MTIGASSADPVSSSSSTILSRVALGIAFVVFAFGIIRLVAFAAVAFSYPYAFDYGEGVVWQQMRNMLSGEGYAPLGIYPAVAYEYPPLYHMVTAAVAKAGGMDQLYAGRLVSFVSALVCGLLVGLITQRSIRGEEGKPAVIAAWFAALAFVSLPLLDTWALLMRIDMLSCALTLVGMWLAARAPWSTRAAIGAGLAFAAALYARQTSLPAPAAAFVVLLIVRPRAAWIMAASALVTGTVALIALEVATQGGFLIHILLYNLNRVIWNHAFALALVLLSSIVLLALGAVGGCHATQWLALSQWRQWRERWSTDRTQVMLAIVLVTLVFKTLTLPAILKSGASDNYLIDWFTQICILAGIATLPLARAAIRLPAAPGMLLIALVTIGLPVEALNAPSFPDRAKVDRDRAALDQIVTRIRSSERPVISDDATLLLRAGKPMLWEPSIIAELGSAGRYDQRSFIAMVRRGDFGFFVTAGKAGDTLFDQRFNPAVADAIEAAYPIQQVIGGRTLHLPRGSAQLSR